MSKKLAVRPPQELDPVTKAEGVAQDISETVRSIAEYLSTPDLTPAGLAMGYDLVTQLEDNLKDLKEAARTGVLDLLTTKGQVVSEKGTMKGVFEGWVMEARPSRTGYDPKRIEAIIRARGESPEKYMSTIVTFGLDESTPGLMLAHDYTQDELNACRYPPSWAVQRPKKAKEDES